VRWDLNVVLICISFMARNAEHSLIIFLVIWLFYLFSFFFYIIGEQEYRTRPAYKVELTRTSGRGEVTGKWGRSVNMVYKMCTHVCKWKNDTH
jgi:hypothetical protein